MGGGASKGASKKSPDGPPPAPVKRPSQVSHSPIAPGELTALRKAVLQKTADEKLLFDGCCHYSNYMQQSEGIEALTRAMDKHGVGYAALTGCPFKKTWVGRPEDPPPQHHLYDDGDLYNYSACDGNLHRTLQQESEARGLSTIARFSMLGCGMNLGDYSSGDEAKALLETYPLVSGFGEITLQSDDINNMTIKGGNWTYTAPSVKRILQVASEQSPPLPFVFCSDARSVTTKPYRAKYEYLDEVKMVCEANPQVKCLWCGAGVFARGQWSDYPEVVHALIDEHPNLYVAFTPELCAGLYKGINREKALELAEELADRVVLCTTVRGIFEGKPPAAFDEMCYTTQIEKLKYFAEQVETRCGKAHGAAVRYRTACKVYNLPLPDDPDADFATEVRVKRGATLKRLLQKENSLVGGKMGLHFISSLAYGSGGGRCSSLTGMEAVCPPSRTDQKWDTVDCHLHLLDFLQKSAGTTAALKAMDGCDVKKAVVFGMPCCKKWQFYRPEQPLYYQDDNGPCYVYAYADQMVADAWLALADDDRARFAPCFASFDPTDLAALAHVKRLYYKYPKMWRGIGEIMCRHDDLTTMLLGKEIPRVDHPAMDKIYEFAVEINLPVLVHHNSDRVGDNDAKWEYVHEVENVLKKHPKLRFVWVHAGVSRRCSEPEHHSMIDRMCTTYDNLRIDISWVVWEDVICDAEGNVKEDWVKCIQKHHTKFFIGSDNVAQFFPIHDTSVNLLSSNITKYYQLFAQLTEEAAQNVAYGNAQREYFEDWDMPKGDELGPYYRMPAYYTTECLDPTPPGSFVTIKELGDGKY